MNYTVTHLTAQHVSVPYFSFNSFFFSAGGARDRECTNALLYMIAVDNLPFNTPEKKGFRRFVKTLQPLYKPLTEKTSTKKMATKYGCLKEHVGKKFKNVKRITLTTDVWTEGQTCKSYVGVTAHYLEGTEFYCGPKTTKNGLRTRIDRSTELVSLLRI